MIGSEGRRLTVDVETRIGRFYLQMQMEVGAEIMVLFGPSGAGKTTTLNAIAGLLTPDVGEITLDGTVLFRKHRPGTPANLPARRRGIGYVFQSYALFPHLTALENVAYPLWRRRDAGPRAAALLERVHLQHLASRYPHQLSGGQQQRIALARALAADPEVLLLDEPFSALDAAVRDRLQRDLRSLQSELGLTMLYVTHRLEDAFAMGHRLAVIYDGRVQQVGALQDVLRSPASYDVAQIMGIRNLFHVKVEQATPEALVLNWEGWRLEAPPRPARAGTRVTAYIQPEDIKIIYPDRPLVGPVHHNQAAGQILESRLGAGHRQLRVRLENGCEVEVRFPHYAYAPLNLSPGETVRLSLRKDALAIL